MLCIRSEIVTTYSTGLYCIKEGFLCSISQVIMPITVKTANTNTVNYPGAWSLA